MSTRCPVCSSKNISIDSDAEPVQCLEPDCRWHCDPPDMPTPLTRNEIKELILECLAVHDDRKKKRRKRPAPIVTPETPPDAGAHIYALCLIWSECVGVVPVGRIGKAFKPLLDHYDVAWIGQGVRLYAMELHRENKMRYASPEIFASKATGYILPAVPSNALTKREAELLGQEMVTAREHAATLGLLTERARG